MRYAIIGFGCAGVNAARAIRTSDPDGEIYVFEKTGNPPTNPMLTTYYASDVIRYQAVFPFGDLEEIEKAYRLKICSEKTVVHVSADQKELHFADGEREKFDKILISTGARAFVPPIEGYPNSKVFLMRTMEDAIHLREYLDVNQIRQGLVVGASMVGIKVAELLNDRGVKTTLADFADFLFPLAAFEDVARELERRVRGYGIDFLWKKGLSAISDNGAVFADGTEVEADIICLCIGTRASTELLANKEVVDGETVCVKRGIVVDERMQTNIQDIYAAGDCCEGTNLLTGQTMIIGLWQNAGIQGDVAGHNMAGVPKVYRGTIPHNITHFMDVYFIGIGDNRAAGELLCYGELSDTVCVRAIVSEGRLKCVNIIGNSEIGGILKSFFLKQLSMSGLVQFPKIQRMMLMKNGLPEEFINLLEGGLQ